MDLFIQLSVVFVGLLFTIFLLRYLLRSDKKVKNLFTAEDGTQFHNEKLCIEYNLLYNRLKSLYQTDYDLKSKNKKDVLGMNALFVSKLKSEGFSDIKSLLKYKDDFKILSDLMNTQELSDDERINS